VVIPGACGSPIVPAAIWRLIPDTFLPASYPFSPAVSAFYTLCASIMPHVVLSGRMASLRTMITSFF
jgi:hypothetical protein